MPKGIRNVECPKCHNPVATNMLKRHLWTKHRVSSNKTPTSKAGMHSVTIKKGDLIVTLDVSNSDLAKLLKELQ